MWGLLFGKNKKTTQRFAKQRRAQAQQAQRKLFFEGLEDRRVLAVTAVLAGGNLTINGDNSGDAITLTVSNPNTVKVNGITMFPGGVTYIVPGNITVNTGTGADNIKLSGLGAAATLNGNVTVNMGDGANTFVEDGTLITLLANHDLNVTSGNGANTETIDNLMARNISVTNGSGKDTVSMAQTSPVTATGVVTIKNGPNGGQAQSVVLGSVANAFTVGGNLQIVEGAGASSYTETLNNYHVTGPISIQNANGAAGATATVTLTEPMLATANGGTLDVYNGNNSVNTITLTNGVFAGYIALRNGSASGAAGNSIKVDGVTANNNGSNNTGNTSSFNNGYSANNQILLGESSSVAFNGFLAANAPVIGGVNNIQWGTGTSIGAVTLVNGPGVAPPTASSNTIITGDQAAISVTGNLTVVNANASVSNTANLNSFRGPLTVTGNVSVNNGATATTNVSVGNALNLSVINGNLTITDAATTAATNVTVNRLNVGPVIGPPATNGNVSIANLGAGADTVTIGAAAPVNIASNLTINQGPGASAYTVNVTNYSAGGPIFIQNGAGTGNAAVTLTKAPNATNNGGGLTVINGDNASNSTTVNGGTFAGALKLMNGAATTSFNLIKVDGVTETTVAGNSFTNGPAVTNDIIQLGVTTLVTLADTTALNNSGAGANNLIDLARGTISGNTSLTNANTVGTALNNTVNVADAAAVTINGGGNLKVSNASAANSNAVGLGSFASALNVDGAVTVTNGASGLLTQVLVGNVGALSTFGGALAITNAAAGLAGNKTDSIQNLTVGGITIVNNGNGADLVNIGTAALVTDNGNLSVTNNGGGVAAVATTNLSNVSVAGNTTYAASGANQDFVNLNSGFSANNVGSAVNIATSGGNDVVSIGTIGAATIYALFVNMGDGDDLLAFGAGASGFATGPVSVPGSNRWIFDGGNGNDTLTISTLLVANFPTVFGADEISRLLNWEIIN